MKDGEHISPSLTTGRISRKKYNRQYGKFIDLAPNHHIYEAILCRSRQNLHNNVVNKNLSVLVAARLHLPTEC